MARIKMFVDALISLLVVSLLSTLGYATPPIKPPGVVIPRTHPLIKYEGRWDKDFGTWWAGTGIKLHIQGLSSLTLNLGQYTSSPYAEIGVSVGGGPAFAVNVTAGVNVIPLGAIPKTLSTTVHVNTLGHANNRVTLESILLNREAKLLPYKPKSKITFQFIGDSFSTGYLCPIGINQAWTFLVGEKYEAEYRVTAQPGAALTNIYSYGSVNGMSFQFFRTEDTGFYYDPNHNYTTPWNFKKDDPVPTHVVLHIGANDSAQKVTRETFAEVYHEFVDRLRKLYPKQPIFLMTPWGWPVGEGIINYYYEGLYQEIFAERQRRGDKNIFLIDAAG